MDFSPYLERFFLWLNQLPGVEAADAFIRSTGLNPGYLGFLLSLVVLGALGIFRSRK